MGETQRDGRIKDSHIQKHLAADFVDLACKEKVTLVVLGINFGVVFLFYTYSYRIKFGFERKGEKKWSNEISKKKTANRRKEHNIPADSFKSTAAADGCQAVLDTSTTSQSLKRNSSISFFKIRIFNRVYFFSPEHGGSGGS